MKTANRARTSTVIGSLHGGYSGYWGSPLAPRPYSDCGCGARSSAADLAGGVAYPASYQMKTPAWWRALRDSSGNTFPVGYFGPVPVASASGLVLRGLPLGGFLCEEVEA